MKLLMENWRNFLKEGPEADAMQTIGDLRNAVRGAMMAKRVGAGKHAVKDIAVGMLADLVPGGGTAKSLWDVAKSMYSLPDEKKTDTALDALNVDDEISAIVDDTIENAFMKVLGDLLKKYPDDTSLEEVNVTTLLTNYIAKEFKNRVVAEPK